MSVLLIIDGDVLAYQACKPRWQTKAKILGGTSYVSLDEDGNKIPLEYTAEEDAEYLERSWGNFKKDLELILDEHWTDNYLMAVKGPDNFRNILYPDYKLNRHKPEVKQNKFVPVIRKLAIKEGLAIDSEGREADDLMRIWAGEAANHDVDYIICSIDKDLRCIPGKHHNLKTKVTDFVSQWEADRFYYQQLISGDPTDNIPGVPGIAAIKAAKALAGATTIEELQEVTVNMYIKAYGDEWKDYLLANGKLIHLQEDYHNYFQVSHWPIVQELGF